MHVDLCFLSDLVLCDLVEVGERLVHECRHVSGSLQDFGISTVVDKLQYVFKDLLDVSNFFEISRNQGHFSDHFLFFCTESLLKIVSQLCLFLV